LVTVADAAMTVSLDGAGIGPAAAVATNSLWLGSLAIAGFSSGYYFPAHPEQARPTARGAINAISQGLVDIRTQVFPLAEAAEAHRRAENGPVGGKILLAT
jgi:NADPH:quinone reductase